MGIIWGLVERAFPRQGKVILTVAVFIRCFLYTSLGFSTRAIDPWHIFPKDGVKFSQGISQTSLEQERIIPEMRVKEGLLPGGIILWWRGHIYMKSSCGLVWGMEAIWVSGKWASVVWVWSSIVMGPLRCVKACLEISMRSLTSEWGSHGPWDTAYLFRLMWVVSVF